MDMIANIVIHFYGGQLVEEGLIGFPYCFWFEEGGVLLDRDINVAVFVVLGLYEVQLLQVQPHILLGLRWELCLGLFAYVVNIINIICVIIWVVIYVVICIFDVLFFHYIIHIFAYFPRYSH